MAGNNPTKARGARSQANLKRGGSPGRPVTTPEEKAMKREAQKIAQKLLDKTYLANLKERLDSGRCAPGVEVAVMQFAWGKPKEEVEVKQVVPIRISHEYAGE